MSIVNINSNNFEKEVLKDNNKFIIVDFWAEWCNPCKMISKELNKINNDLEDIQIKICKINIDVEKDLSTNFLIKSIPTLIFYLNGSEIKRMTGFNNKNKILSVIKDYQRTNITL